MLFALIVILIVGVGLLLYGWWDTNRFDVRKTEIQMERLPRAFDGFTILQISDLHNRAYGKDGQALIRTVQGLSFDCVAFTGDLLDRHLPRRRKNAYALVKALAAQGPMYFVQGNHEWEIGDYETTKAELTSFGVVILDEKRISLCRGDDQIELCGIREETTRAVIEGLVPRSVCSILLAHHPERIEEYARTGVDLVLSGHAHGGQVRLLDQGLFSPDQWLLPRYTSGVYTCGKTELYVSRGAGNHSFLPPRIFNRPEIDLITLKTPSR